MEAHTIKAFNEYFSWISRLKEIDERLWTKPIAEGKWSIREIIAHITNWDHHLLSNVLPAVRNERGMEFPDFDTYNRLATDYAQSGITKAQLIEKAIATRKQLVRELREMPIKNLNKPLTSNGVTHCPVTGTPYSLLYIIKEFTDHDNHHKKQIHHFLEIHTVKNNM